MALEREARDQADVAGDAFEEALSVLGSKRPRIAPPGRYGCLSLVVSGEVVSPGELDTAFSEAATLDRRGAISAAVLAPEAETEQNNVLSSFFATIEERSSSDGVVGLVGSVMDLWGRLLVSYGDLSQGLSDMADDLLGSLDGMGAGPIASWLRDRLGDAVHALDLEPVDLRLTKPVLTDTSNVIARSGMASLGDAQGLLRSIPLGTTDPGALLQAVGYQVGDYIVSAEFTIAEIPLPAGGSIPLTIRLRDVLGTSGGR